NSFRWSVHFVTSQHLGKTSERSNYVRKRSLWRRNDLGEVTKKGCRFHIILASRYLRGRIFDYIITREGAKYQGQFGSLIRASPSLASHKHPTGLRPSVVPYGLPSVVPYGLPSVVPYGLP